MAEAKAKDISRRTFILRAVTIFLISLIALIPACSGDKSNSKSTTTVAAISGTVTKETRNPIHDLDRASVAGKSFYMVNCAFCHGNDGKGDPETQVSFIAKTTDLTSDRAISSTDEEIFLAIKNGIMKDGKMTMPPAKNLTDEQIWQITAFVRTFSRR